MGTITSGIGLISGMDHTSLVEQLLKIEARPRDQLLARISTIDAQKAAYLDISARLTALLSQVQLLAKRATFQGAKSTSSKPDVLSVTSAAGAAPGSYQFTVRALAATHQLVSRGFGDRSAPLAAGTLTLESAKARVDRATPLSVLNGYAGVQRGQFKITNSAGAVATINIIDALTLDDVVEKINAAGLQVTASVRSDAVVLTDASGGTGTLRIDEVGGNRTAADLGFGLGRATDSDHDGTLSGANLTYLSDATPLAALNDGLGVRCSKAGGDFTIQADGTAIAIDLSDTIKPETRLQRLNHGRGVRLGTVRVTSRDGTIATVDLSSAQTVADVQTALRNAFGDQRLTVTLTGDHLVISDGTEFGVNVEPQKLKIEDVSGHAAEDLGIRGEVDSTRIDGKAVLHNESLADILAAINYAAANVDAGGAPLVQVAFGSNGRSLLLTSASGGELVLTDGGSAALADLGLTAGTYTGTVAGQRIIGGLDSVLLRTLRGGAGVGTGTIALTAGGGTVQVDLSAVDTLADAVDLINQAAQQNGLGVTMSCDSTGTRLVVTNDDGGTAAIQITDVAGTFAQDTGLAAADGSGGRLRGDNLQRQYINEATLLSELNNGRGISFGSFTISNAVGQIGTVDLNASAHRTLQDVIDEIESLNIGVEARINDTGDGLLLVDTTTGSNTFKITDTNGTAARDLNIRGEFSDGQVDGSFEFKFELGTSLSLETLASRIGTDTTLAQATLLNDGTGTAPYRLSITSLVAGSLGELIIDDTDTDFRIATLTRPQDARVLFGGSAESGVLLTSATNTFDDVISGLSITVSATSDEPVTIAVQRDLDSALSALRGVVEDFNDAASRMADVSDYDPETEERGILLGEGTLRTIESRLFRMFTRYIPGSTSAFHRLRDIGITLESGSQLGFDEDEFKAAYESDPEGVMRLFTDETAGVAKTLKEELEKITNAEGLIQSRSETLDEKRDSLQTRVDQLNDLLDRKRIRLLRDFQVMETVLARLQSQQSSLADLVAANQSLTTTS